ncbi:MAG: sugar transferase, partial [Coprobacillus sp.]
MILKKWENIPEIMKNDYVKEYYDILSHRKISLILKRIFDIVMATILLLLLSPILLILAVWIKLDSQGPIFYRQERITTNGKTFRIYKFRTMVVDADKKGALVTSKNDSRITNIGQKIRKCRLDEFPQLINVLKGEMTFVGTRPEVKKYVNAYTDEMKATLLLPAGVTSFASIRFKDEDEIISSYVTEKKSIDDVYIEMVLPQKMDYNLEYLKKFKFLEDIK